MARRTLITIANGLEGWDADLRDNLDTLGMDDEPMTLPYEPIVGSLPAIGTHDYSQVVTSHAELGKSLVFDDGTEYQMVYTPWAYECGASTGGTVTSLTVQGMANGFQFGASAFDRPNGFPLEIFYVASTTKHTHGSDPGDWTLTLEQIGGSSVTFAMALSSTGDPQITIGKPSAVLSIAAGQYWRASASGPSTAAPGFIAQLYGRIKVPQVIA